MKKNRGEVPRLKNNKINRLGYYLGYNARKHYKISMFGCNPTIPVSFYERLSEVIRQSFFFVFSTFYEHTSNLF